MENGKDFDIDPDSAQSKGFGGGMILGIVIGAALFLATVQILYWAR